MRYIFIAILAIFSAYALDAHAQASAVYKWKDAKGVMQYSDYPPEGVKYEVVQVKSGTSVTHSTSEDKADKPRDKADPKNVPVYQENCNIANQNLKVLNTSAGVAMDLDGDGENEMLTEDQRLEKIAEFEKLKGIYCRGGDDDNKSSSSGSSTNY